MSATCPEGHTSEATDYCDTCGAIIAATATPKPPSFAPPPAAAQPTAVPVAGSCPQCDTAHGAADVFCEVCGLDFASGEMPKIAAPQPAAAAPAPPAQAVAVDSGWVAVVTPDKAWFDTNQAAEPDATVAFPSAPSTRDVSLRIGDTLIGRGDGNTFPDIDLSTIEGDSGVSRRHAVLSATDTSLTITDLDSTNGTRIGDANAKPIAAKTPVELDEGTVIYLGAFCSITIRGGE